MLRQLDLPESCVFSDYFKLNAYPEEILAYFGYHFATRSLDLPTATLDPQAQAELQHLQQRIQRSLPLISFSNEMVRREFLIAPILMGILPLTQARLKTAYPLDVTPQLRGSLDYWIEADRHLLIIEAKDENLERGFQQLAVELVAIAQGYGDRLPPQVPLWGAVSIGKIWQFAYLDLPSQTITQDLNLYRVPADLDGLYRALVGMLRSPCPVDTELTPG